MSNGILGPGECIDVAVKGTSDLFFSTAELYNTQQFVNPQLINILNMNSAADNSRQRADVYRTYLESIVPPPPDLAILLQQVDDFEAAVNDYQTAVMQHQIWTNYLSGKSPQFPAGGPSGLNTGFLFNDNVPPDNPWQLPMPPFYALLAGFGFVGLWGAVKGGNQSAYVKCEVDPDDPCANVKKILGAVMGIYNTILNAMINGLNAMVDFAANILSYIAQVIGFIEDLVAIIVNAIAELAMALVNAIRDGLARLLGGLKIDPCLSVVLSNCCGPQLKSSLGI